MTNTFFSVWNAKTETEAYEEFTKRLAELPELSRRSAANDVKTAFSDNSEMIENWIKEYFS